MYRLVICTLLLDLTILLDKTSLYQRACDASISISLSPKTTRSGLVYVNMGATISQCPTFLITSFNSSKVQSCIIE